MHREYEFLVFITHSPWGAEPDPTKSFVRVATTSAQGEALIADHMRYHEDGKDYAYTMDSSPWYFDSFTKHFFCKGCEFSFCPVTIAKGV